MLTLLRPTLVLLGLFTILLGGLYPLAMTAFARLAFPWQAGGSVIHVDGRVVGSALIGQETTSPDYFLGRPSATTGVPTNAAASGASNLGPSNPALTQAVAGRIRHLQRLDPGLPAAISLDLVTASASGLDPHISPQAALCQIPRIARLRDLPETRLRDLVAEHTLSRWPWLFGEDRVVVLELNLALDRLQARSEADTEPSR